MARKTGAAFRFEARLRQKGSARQRAWTTALRNISRPTAALR